MESLRWLWNAHRLERCRPPGQYTSPGWQHRQMLSSADGVAAREEDRAHTSAPLDPWGGVYRSATTGLVLLSVRAIGTRGLLAITLGTKRRCAW